MRLTSTRPPGVFWVDWWLMNHCSWQCSYCAEIIRNGTIPTPALRDCQKFLDDLRAHVSQQINISFTGGEVTEWPQLADLLEYCGTLEITTAIRSNGHCDHGSWTRIVDAVSHLDLHFHPEHSSTARFLSAIKSAKDRDRSIKITLNMMPQRFQEILDMEQLILSRWPGTAVDRRMLFEDPVRNTQPQQYSEEQQAQLTNQWGDLLLEQGEQRIYTDFQTMVVKDQNRFRDHRCWAGLEQMIVDAWGKVFRSHCRQWGSLGHIGGQIRWPKDPMICMKDQCVNGFDILAKKEST